MSLVIDTPHDWSLTALDVITGAMQLCQAIGVGETVAAPDVELCMRSLDGFIKEMPIHGFQWPQVSSDPVAITWSVVTPSLVTPPLDYFGCPVLKRTDANGSMVTLRQVSKEQWERFDLTQTAAYPEYFYVPPDLSFRLYPAPTQDPVLTLTYQSILPDIVLTAAPSIQQQYLNSLQYFLADEIALKYGVPQAERVELAARATQKKFLLTQWATEQSPICITVDDGCYPRTGPLEWR